MESGNEKIVVQALLDRIAGLEEKLSEQSDTERFRLVVEGAPNGIILANEDGEIIMVNRRAEEMFGYDREVFVGMSIEDLVPERFREKHKEQRRDFHKSPEVRAFGPGRDLHAIKKDGTEFPVEIGLTPLPEKDGSLVLCAILDITEHQKAYAKVQFQSEILRNVHDAVFYLCADGEILDWNEAAERVFDISHDDAVGSNFFSFLTTDSRSSFVDRLFPAISNDGSAERVFRCSLKNGRDLFIRAKGTRLKKKDRDGYVICASDITEQKRLESKIVSISENEQRRIGQDIHDDLCSQLSGIACITKAMEATLGKAGKEDAEMMAKISSMVADAVTKARQIAKGLVPAALETQGLKGALEELIERNREVFGAKCRIVRCDAGATDDLPPTVGTQLFRIAQEAITNAIKHGEADSIEVSLALTKDQRLELKVIDDGKGMPVELVTTGLGLLTMQQRAEMIGAEFFIRAFPEKGTRIICSLPKPMKSDE